MTNAETSLRWLARPVPDFAKVRQLTERIAGSAQRADDIVRRIRGMAAKQQPEQVALNLNEVVQESLLFVRHEVDSRSIRVTASYTRGLEPVRSEEHTSELQSLMRISYADFCLKKKQNI